MCKKIVASVCLLACTGAFAAPTCGVVDGKYVFTVPEGETYTLTADDVATMMSADYVTYPFAKAGAGTLVVGDVIWYDGWRHLRGRGYPLEYIKCTKHLDLLWRLSGLRCRDLSSEGNGLQQLGRNPPDGWLLPELCGDWQNHP